MYTIRADHQRTQQLINSFKIATNQPDAFLELTLSISPTVTMVAGYVDEIKEVKKIKTRLVEKSQNFRFF